MSGFGTCGVCKKPGFSRKGSAMCTRCEKKSTPAVITKEPAAPEPASTAVKPKPARRRKPYIRAHGRVVAK